MTSGHLGFVMGAVLWGTPVVAQGNLDCLRGAVEFAASNLKVMQGFNHVEYTLTVTNGTDAALGGFNLRYSLLAQGRPSPLEEWWVEEVHVLGGGLLPDEQTSITAFISMDEHTGPIAAEAEVLSVTFDLVNAADTDGRPMVAERDVFGLWGDDLSPQVCVPL